MGEGGIGGALVGVPQLLQKRLPLVSWVPQFAQYGIGFLLVFGRYYSILSLKQLK
jgi:hypothetical protein